MFFSIVITSLLASAASFSPDTSIRNVKSYIKMGYEKVGFISTQKYLIYSILHMVICIAFIAIFGNITTHA